MDFLQAETMNERLKMMEKLKDGFFERAAEIDENNGFPFENIKELKESGYTALTVPKQFGGKDISLYEMIRLQERIAEGDGSTALAIGWHMGIIKNLGEKGKWEDDMLEFIFSEALNGKLINAAATEPKTGSPTRGGKPETTAVKTDDGWLVNGHKTFTSLAPALDYILVSATIEETGEVGNFLVPAASSGVRIEETWDSIALKGTGSHDLFVENVHVPHQHFVDVRSKGKKGAEGWLLHIPACYLGIAQAAQTYAIQFSKEYSPNSIKGTISELPNVQEKIGEMELEMMRARSFLYSVAKQWDEASKADQADMLPELGAVKLAVTNAAIVVVDLAMRVVGAKSLSLKNPLQRFYRDVRAGIHNPPMDDMTIMLLAKSALERGN
ncbi:acyl-CoA dehydrogenase family protein [Falsibacillus albus]|uniref:Acyl-CoA dehydrogenase n=1 Tax=Falsibacillus albus TaxID=2478915 RepID=A0A3L7JR87_9BACI|nr:acyl-CoA dehydrogenase family protein [Falsibacillus albus]RLQ93338.1 acyl-CoA dehydrogenase [Falsibacillus albus]